MYGKKRNLSGFYDVSNPRVRRLAVNPYEFKRDMKTAAAPFSYSTNPVAYVPLSDCSQFIPGVPNPHLQNRGIDLSQVDIESELKNQTRANSRCPVEKFDPTIGCHPLSTAKDMGLPCVGNETNKSKFNRSECFNQIIPVPTRLEYIKPCNLPGAWFNRFEPLCDKLQDLDKIDNNSRIGLDTRNYTKDKYQYSVNKTPIVKFAGNTMKQTPKCCIAGKMGCGQLSNNNGLII